MGDSRKIKVFRDLQVAMDFKAMAKMGYVDTEFTMYGCAYWEENVRNYLISINAREIWAFMEASKRAGRYTTPLKKISKSCPVPKGQQEEIANSVKIGLIDELAAAYPIKFWKEFEELSQVVSRDNAAEFLEVICKNAEHSFSQEQVDLAENLLDYSYEIKAIGQLTYQRLGGKLKRMRKNFLEDTVAKDILQKNFYTIMYELEDSQYKRVTNARKEWIYHKKYQLEIEGKTVSPIYAKCYWYSNQTSLEKVRKRHDKHCNDILDEAYFSLVKRIKALAEVAEKDKFKKKYTEMLKNQSGDTREMLKYYGSKWGLLNQGSSS